MPAVYAIDLIAKRDKKMKMDRSIIKGWNVHYQTLEEVEEAARAKKREEEEEARKNAQKHTQDPKDYCRRTHIIRKQVLIPDIMGKSR